MRVAVFFLGWQKKVTIFYLNTNCTLYKESLDHIGGINKTCIVISKHFDAAN